MMTEPQCAGGAETEGGVETPSVKSLVPPTASGADESASSSEASANKFPVSYGVDITTFPEHGFMRMSFIFREPEHLAGIEAFHVTLTHQDAGKLCRQVERKRKEIA